MARIATTFSDVLNAIKARMVDRGYESSTIYFGLDPAQLKLPSNVPMTAIICPGEQVNIDPEFNLFRGSFDITLWMLTALDQAEHAEIGLTNSEYGILPQASVALIQSLNHFDLVDDDDNIITANPIKWMGNDEPEKDGLWTSTVFRFEIWWENSATAEENQLPIIDSTAAELLIAFRDRLVSEGVFNANTCFIGSNPKKPRLPANLPFYGVISPTSQTVVSSETMFVETLFNVDLWSYMGLDQAGRNENQLTDLTNGIYPEVDAINAALNHGMLADTDGENALLNHPLILRRIEQPVSEGKWARTRMLYEVAYSYAYEDLFANRAYSDAFSSAWG